MTKIALDHGATIDKYIGDAVMLFFGDPTSKGEREDARACVKMSLKMQERMEYLKNKWKNSGFLNPFQIRIGINTGYCNVGNFGSDQRLTYTIIGGEVNIAARLETAGEIKMKGVSRKVKIFEVTGRKTSEIECAEIIAQDSLKDNKKIDYLNNKIKEIDKQFRFLKKLIDDLNNEKKNL